MNGSRAWLERDFYKVLGVPEIASAEEIKRAYRKIAREHHPDRNPGDHAAEERMKDASEAYDVLSDSAKRTEYDKVRRMAASGFTASPGGFRSGVRFDDGTGVDLGDLLGDLLGGRGFGPAGRARRGADLETEVRIEFADAIHGVTVPVHVERDVACRTCGGTGSRSGAAPVCTTCGGSGATGDDQGLFSFMRTCPACGGAGRLVTDPCRTCRGSGAVRTTEELKIRIPAGVTDGARIRARGRGRSGRGGAGDLSIRVSVAPHPLFGRRGSDLTITVPVTFSEAALGAEIEVPTLEDAVRLRIPAGTQSGRTFRVRGRGAPKPKGGRGDLLATVQVRVPEKLSKKGRELLEQFAKVEPAAPRAPRGVS